MFKTSASQTICGVGPVYFFLNFQSVDVFNGEFLKSGESLTKPRPMPAFHPLRTWTCEFDRGAQYHVCM